MKTTIFLMLVIVAIGVAAAIFSKKTKGNTKKSAVRSKELINPSEQNIFREKGAFGPKELLSSYEQNMFWRLVAAFPAPEYIVLTQVSFGALLTATNGASRNSFSQKRADFVLANKGFKVLAMIELDDSSHKGREEKDADRDAMLIEAGYKVLRYRQIPEVGKLRSDFMEESPNPDAEAHVSRQLVKLQALKRQ